jgi:type VI secretion system secreted protein Hcp
MILLYLSDVKGDSQIDGYPDWISCTSVSWEITREFSESAKAGTRDINVGVADLPPITIGKSFDKSSMELMFAGAGKGKVSTQAKIHFLATGDTSTPKNNLYLEFILDNPIISSWSISGDEDERPTEEISLWYWKVWMKYYTFDGSAYVAAGDKGWDRLANKQWSP